MLCYVTTFVHNCVHTVVTDRFRLSSVVFCIFIITGSVCLCHDIFLCFCIDCRIVITHFIITQIQL